MSVAGEIEAAGGHTIPDEVKTAFIPEGVPETMPPRARFPSPPPPPLHPFRQRRQVEWRDLDAAGHVNNTMYLNYVEDCGIQMVAAHGWPMARMEAESFAVVARAHHIEYKQPAVMDDELEVMTWASSASRILK